MPVKMVQKKTFLLDTVY